jgi:hypothetical protein
MDPLHPRWCSAERARKTPDVSKELHADFFSCIQGFAKRTFTELNRQRPPTIHREDLPRHKR